MPQSVPRVVSSSSSLRSTPPRPWVDASGLLLSLSCCSLLSLVCTVFWWCLQQAPFRFKAVISFSSPAAPSLPLALLSLGQWSWWWTPGLWSSVHFPFSLCLSALKLVGWFLCLLKSSIPSNLLLLLVTLFFFYRISYLLLFKHCFLLIDSLYLVFIYSPLILYIVAHPPPIQEWYMLKSPPSRCLELATSRSCMHIMA